MKCAALASILLSARAAEPEANIVELAESIPDLSSLVSAVVAADLVETLSSPGPFTVVAPTNAAFEALPAGTLDDLMKPENKAKLVDILTYHVVPEQILSTRLLAPIVSAKTVEGSSLYIYKNAAGLRISPDGKDFKSVTLADNLATNGAVHIIDGVLLPSSAVEMQTLNLVSYLDTRCKTAPYRNYDVFSGQCYSYAPRSDQSITCLGNGDVEVKTFHSSDGSCTEAKDSTIWKQGSCQAEDLPWAVGRPSGVSHECQTSLLV